jgi:hypothetical protein
MSTGISGRKLTPVVIVVLMGLCFCVAYFVTVVHYLQQARDRTHQSWRQLAVQLDRDYRLIEQHGTDLPKPDTPSLSDSITNLDADRQAASDFEKQLRDFQSLAQAFRTEVDLTKQRELADEVERTLAAISSLPPAHPDHSETTQSMVAQYNAHLQEERSILTSASGRMVRVFLVMPELPDLELSR